MTSSRTGIGIDVHRLKKGGPIILGGVQIPHEYGLLGHSDGDVLLHAVIDGFLGAANMGDIGVHFPSDNPDYKGISSEILLETAFSLIVEKGWKPVFVDATIIAEKPRLAKFVPQMKIKIDSIKVFSVSVLPFASFDKHLGIQYFMLNGFQI